MLKYAGTFAINHEKIRKHPETISKIKPYLDQYHWKDITKDWKIFKQTTEQLFLISCLIKKWWTRKNKISLHYKTWLEA